MDPEPVDGRAGKLASKVARRIEGEIIGLGWPIGDLLGSELDLRERHGVSRSVLREAVRLVEHHRVGRMRRGPNGGLVVCAPDAGPATRAVVIYLEYIGTTIDHLINARLLLEPVAASLAAGRVSEEGIARLRQTLRNEADSGDEPRPPSQGAHVVIGELSGNPALALFIDVLARLTRRYARESEVDRVKDDSNRGHVALVEAIIAGDAGLAASQVTRHLDAVAQRLPSLHEGRAAPTGFVEEPAAKLAEVVAARIHEAIAAAGWRIGEVVGSEAALLAHYGVSRAVLREAIRLLEYHAVASMRRGPGGGLLITTPEPAASIETMALYLDYRGVTGEDLRVVREAIELGTVRRVTARRAEPEVADRLERAIARTGEPTAPGRTGADRFHIALADLAGNPVLPLFLRITTELWTRHGVNAAEPVQPGPEAAAEVEQIHRLILRAVLDGDEPVARHRMRRHLEALAAWYR